MKKSQSQRGPFESQEGLNFQTKRRASDSKLETRFRFVDKRNQATANADTLGAYLSLRGNPSSSSSRLPLAAYTCSPKLKLLSPQGRSGSNCSVPVEIDNPDRQLEERSRGLLVEGAPKAAISQPRRPYFLLTEPDIYEWRVFGHIYRLFQRRGRRHSHHPYIIHNARSAGPPRTYRFAKSAIDVT